MSVVSDVVGSVFGGGKAAEAASGAASSQSQSIDKAIAFQERAQKQARDDLAIYRSVGSKAILGWNEPDTNIPIAPSLKGLILNPDRQRRFIEDNPFYESLADDAQRRLLSNQAAKGKVGSGGTAEALQNSLLLLGSNLVNQSISQRMNLATLGANAASMTASTGMGGARNISDLMTQQGNALAAGQIGASNAMQDATGMGLNTIIGLGSIASSAGWLSDRRFKTDIKALCKVNGHNTYLFKYIGDDSHQVGVMAQEVERINPNAVGELGGIKFVNYGAL